jgi:hypothetical protein
MKPYEVPVQHQKEPQCKSTEYYYSRRKSCESTASEGNPVIGTASEGNPVNRTASEVKNSIRRKPCEKL